MRGDRGYHTVGRRCLLLGSASLLVGCRRLAAGTPEARWGVQSGDVTSSSAAIWSRADRSSRMVVEWDTSPTFSLARRAEGPVASSATDLCAKMQIGGLPAGARVHYRVRFEAEQPSEWVAGTLLTAPSPAATSAPGDVVFAWSGDTNGQGWGIDPARGGMPAYRALLERAPDFFVHCGDTIYADDPIPPTLALEGGGVWNNLVTEAKSHVAQTLDDFRGAHLYGRHSAEVRALSAAAPLMSIWDDHEVHNDWFPGQVLDDARYTTRDIDVLAARARRAMYEYTPTLRDPRAPMYRAARWGPRLELFFVDGRRYRTPNVGVQASTRAGARFFGPDQVAWLDDAVARSTATWKVVVCDMPLGLVIGDRAPWSADGVELDAFANGDGPPAGRELELARLFRSWRARRVKNVVFLTADVHYAAAHRFSPERAVFKEMDPFWEFVAGPMHATSFPRKPLDDTFGPEVEWASHDRATFGSPATGQQYFGLVRIEGRSGRMTVALVDGRGRTLHTTTLDPAA